MEIMTRQQAKAAGQTRYFTGKPCKHGHVVERMVSTRACVTCLAEKKKAWMTENPEKVNSQKRVWRDANLEKARALNSANQKKHRAKANGRNRRYAAQNREELRVKSAKWAEDNPAKVLAKSAKRRAVKLQATPAWANQRKIEEFYETVDGLGMLLGDAYHVDHIVPLQHQRVCGLHVEHNLQILQAFDNRSKSNCHWPGM